jgi:hypothetical protein
MSDKPIGYGNPPKHSQFKKGQSGNPKGRPKAPCGISLRTFLDGAETGKNGEVASRREAMVIALVNSALRGNQRAFSRFMKYLDKSGLLRREQITQVQNHFYDAKPMTPDQYEEFKLNFGRKPDEPWKKYVRAGEANEQ